MCFWYLPDYIRRMEDGEEKNKALHKVGLYSWINERSERKIVEVFDISFTTCFWFLLRTHNICFGLEMRKLIFNFAILSTVKSN